MDPHRADTRAAVRRRTLKGGRITFHFLGASIDCTIRNISPSGACLQVESPVGIPDEFELFVESEKTTRNCRVIWRSGKRLGISFE